ncbi:MAG: AAA family ATPase, partial [Verrucomicrobiota bacterium]|nr:AAA family ATPase [Verrucomicrobiota bacterium]
MYVDKTKELYKMVRQQSGQYFLSRPRRFGKSMTLSTFKAIFQGKKELFKGLYIYDKEYDWKKYPIIHLSMNRLGSKTKEELEENLAFEMRTIAKMNSICLSTKRSYQMLRELICTLAFNGVKVVILIDEYDKPILDNVDDIEECKKIRNLFQQFYGQIKANEEYIRFAFLTGVSKFTQVSVFSDLNNLTDITMDKKFASICGFTQEECEHYFAEWITENAEELNLTKDAYLEKIKIKYNGIRFSEKPVSLYNPVSFINAMKNCDFKNYWFETGTPTFLLKLLKNKDFNLEVLEEVKVPSFVFTSYEIESLEVEPLLYQTGYLTIKDYDIDTQEYSLGYPNEEVAESFSMRLLDYYSKLSKMKNSMIIHKLYESLKQNNLNDFIEVLKVYYANIDYDLKTKDEKCYQLIFYLIFTNLGFRINTEVKTNKGRMDAVVKTPKYIYIFEFKVDKSADSAIE